MKVLHDNYLEQMNEELEIINFKLDCMYEAAFSTETADTEFSLFENVESDVEVMNEEAYQLYTEALDQTLKNIWRAIVRFVKSIFTSSGEVITTKDAKNIVEIISSAAADGDLQSSALKKVAQKGFYLIAGLGNSVDGDKLRQAYESGEVLRFVIQNINKVNVAKIPEDSRFRICIAHYDSSVKNSMAMITYVLETLRDKGVAGIEEMSKNVKDATKNARKAVSNNIKKLGKAIGESIEDDELNEMLESLGIMNEASGQNRSKGSKDSQGIYDVHKPKKLSTQDKVDIAAAFGRQEADAELKRLTNRIKQLLNDNEEQAREYAELLQKTDMDKKAMKAKHRQEMEDLIDAASRMTKRAVIGTAATMGGASLLALGIVGLVNKVRQKRGNSPMNDHLSMATITYVNEDKPDAMAKVRLYGPAGVTNIDIKGRDRVIALRDHLTELAERMSAEGDKFTPGVAGHIREFTTNINLFFAGLADRKK